MKTIKDISTTNRNEVVKIASMLNGIQDAPKYVQRHIDRAKLAISRKDFDSLNSELDTIASFDFESETDQILKYESTGELTRIVRAGLERAKLPVSKVLLAFSHSDFDKCVKVASTIAKALCEEIDAGVSLHSCGQEVEITCRAAGSMEAVKGAALEICDMVIRNSSAEIGVKAYENAFSNFSVCASDIVTGAIRKAAMENL